MNTVSGVGEVGRHDKTEESEKEPRKEGRKQIIAGETKREKKEANEI